MKVERRDVIGLEDKYEIDNRGFVYSKATKKYIKTRINKNGLETIALGGRSKKTYFVDRLVFESFVRPLKETEEPFHKNYDKSNNYLSNLEAREKVVEVEEFVNVPTFPDYEISDKGIIRKKETGLIIQPYASRNRTYVRLIDDKGLHRVQLDRLVCDIFSKKHERGEIIHLDKELLNCNIKNLKVVSEEEYNNFYGKKKLDIEPKYTRKKSPENALIYVLFSRYDNEEFPVFYGTMHDICRTYNVSPNTVYQAIFRLKHRNMKLAPTITSVGLCIEVAGKANEILSDEEMEMFAEIAFNKGYYSLDELNESLDKKYADL